MKQFTFEIYGAEQVPAELANVKAWTDEHAHTAVLVQIYAGLLEKRRIERVVKMVKEALPDALIAGASSGGEIKSGRMIPQSVLICISVFEETTVSMLTYQAKAGEESETGRAVCAAIEGTPEIKAAELFADSWKISTAVLFPEINKCSSRVKMFGAAPYAHDVKHEMFIFTGDNMTDVTLIVILYAGKGFHVTTDYCIGWQPIGTAMTVTKADGTMLFEIDGHTATSVYEKYLQIPADDHFYENAFAFPLLLYTHDTYMLRMPFSCTPEGAVSLVAPVKEGDTLFLSYGDIITLLAELDETRKRMERFRPQYIRLYSCATRKMFWKKNIDKELQPAQRVAESSGFFTGGELLRVNGQLIHFNSTLLIIGMREGTGGSRESALSRRLQEADDTDLIHTAMVRRMAHFINVAMQEAHGGHM